MQNDDEEVISPKVRKYKSAQNEPKEDENSTEKDEKDINKSE